MSIARITQILRDIFKPAPGGNYPARHILARMLLAMALAIILSAALILRMR